MSLRRSLALLFAVSALACSESSTGPTEPRGPETLQFNATTISLAPGREAWLYVSSSIRESTSKITTVTPHVTFESSNTAVATVALDSAGVGHIVARSAGSTTITVRSQRDGNASLAMTVNVAAAPLGNESGLAYSARVTIQPTSSPYGATIPLGPTRFVGSVTISNPTSGQRDVWLNSCGAWVRLYRTADLSGAPASDVPHFMVCTADVHHVVLAPGASTTIDADGTWAASWPDTLPSGRYYAAVAVDRIRDVLPVTAGAVDYISPTAGFTFTAATSVTNGNLAVHATMTNTNAQPVRLEYGDCAVNLLAYRTADRTGTPAWNSMYRQPYGVPNSGYGCLLYLAIGTIQPGETLSPRELNPSFSVVDMLADSLPAARYYFKAEIRMNERITVVPAGDAEVKR